MTLTLVLAAGTGTRFDGGGPPKQFAEIDGRPLLAHTLRACRQAGIGERLVLVAHPDLLARARSALAAEGLAAAVVLCAGGRTRRESVRLGLATARGRWHLAAGDAVVLQNAASPNTDPDTVRRCLAALDTADVAQACVPELRTLFLADDDQVADVLPRPHIVAACDPTIYRLHALEAVLDHLQGQDGAGDTTVDAALALGLRMSLVRSSHDNIKVTTRWDLEAVRAAMTADRDTGPCTADRGAATG